jgi:hypothetical protein
MERMSNWQISESGTSVPLTAGEGEVSFTVTNGGPATDRVVLTVTPLDGAAEEWFTVDRPQRQVEPDASAVFEVAVAVPLGTATGTYGLQGVAYSADSDPSESSVTSKRVTLEVAPSVAPRRPMRWPYIVAAVIALLVILVIVFLLTRNDDDDGDGGGDGNATTTSTTQPLPDVRISPTGNCVVHPNGTFSMFIAVTTDNANLAPQNSVEIVGEIDSGSSHAEVNAPLVTGANGTELVYVGLSGADFVGNHFFVVDADLSDAIPESDENNNHLTVNAVMPGFVPVFADAPVACS